MNILLFSPMLLILNIHLIINIPSSSHIENLKSYPIPQTFIHLIFLRNLVDKVFN